MNVDSRPYYTLTYTQSPMVGLATIKHPHSGFGYSSDDNGDNEDLLEGGNLEITCQQHACKLELCVTRLTTTLKF